MGDTSFDCSWTISLLLSYYASFSGSKRFGVVKDLVSLVDLDSLAFGGMAGPRNTFICINGPPLVVGVFI